MLEINGIPPRLNNQVCEAVICQQYWYQHKLAQQVDALFIKVNGRWHELYFDSDIAFWRSMSEAPAGFAHQPDDPFEYRLTDVGREYGINDSIIIDSVAEPMLEGGRVRLIFQHKGDLIITHSENKTALHFIETA